eukprot:3479615-Rhodomonas_salina.9
MASVVGGLRLMRVCANLSSQLRKCDQNATFRQRSGTNAVVKTENLGILSSDNGLSQSDTRKGARMPRRAVLLGLTITTIKTFVTVASVSMLSMYHSKLVMPLMVSKAGSRRISLSWVPRYAVIGIPTSWTRRSLRAPVQRKA